MNNDPLHPEHSVTRRNFIKGTSLAGFMAFMGGVEITAQEADKNLPVPKADPNFKEKAPGAPVNMGVIGLGAWGREILTQLSRLPNAPIVAVADPYATSLRRSAELAPKAQKYEDYKPLLEDKNVQAVIVAIPTHEHKEVVLAALQAGKHVYCEAPLAHSVEDAAAIAKAARAAKKQVFQTGLLYRANPQHHHVFGFFRSGALGTVALARGQYHKKQSWRRASPNPEREKILNWRLQEDISLGLVGEVGIHQIDVTSWYLNKLPVAITGFGSVMHWRDGRTVADTIQAIIEYPNGMRMVYDATLANSYEGAYDCFYGTDSAMLIRENRAWMFKETDSPLLGWEVYARKEEFGSETGIALVANATKLLAQGKKPAEGAADSQPPLYYGLEEFVGNINEAKAPAAGWQEGYQATVTAIRANEAVRKNTRVEIKPEAYQLPG